MCLRRSLATLLASAAVLALTLPGPARAVSKGPVRFTVAASGDLLIHSPIFNRARTRSGYDFRPMLSAVRPYIARADLGICHDETPLVPGAPASYPLFRTPPDLARAIRSTGWDACSTASNHTLDAGGHGIRTTIAALDHAGVRHSGSFNSARARSRPLIMTVKGVKVAFLAYTEMTNGLTPPHPWSVNIARAGLILSDARRARKLGARVVIVNIHWGDEFRAAPSAFQRRLGGRLIARGSPITAVIGQHVHVVQPIRLIGGRALVYGEGNLISNQTPACCPPASQDGLIVRLDIRTAPSGARVERIRYVPVWTRHPDFKVLPVGDALRGGWASRSELARSYRRTRSVAGAGNGVEPVPASLP